MVLEAPVLQEGTTSTNWSHEEPDAEALIEEARQERRRRYRRWFLTAVFVAAGLSAVLGTVFAFGDIGGSGRTQGPSRHAQPPSASGASSAQTASAGRGVVGRGPTSVDFTDAADGWIASGNVALPLGNPTIVRTTDSGETWHRTPVPNLAAQNVDPTTRYQLGGLVGIHFASTKRGWFFQAGLAWQTNDGAIKWTKTHFPVAGAVVALTSSGGDVWALLDSCPIGTVSCPQNLSRGFLYHATPAANLMWRRVGGPLPGGIGTLYPAAGHSVVVVLGPTTYYRSTHGPVAVARVTGCQTIGTLASGALAGVCGGGGGGDASVSTIAVTTDHGSSWKPLVSGPPSSQFMGSITTNGIDTIFFVTGGQTLWRTSDAQPGWSDVLRAPQGSTDEIYPVFIDGAKGLALISDGLDAHWFKTVDGGIAWQPVTLP